MYQTAPSERHSSRPRLLTGESLKIKLQWYALPRRMYSKRELLADRIVNITGAVLSWLLALWLSLTSYAAQDSVVKQIGFLVHGVGLVTMFNCSAVYHFMCWDSKLAERLYSLDNIGIGAMIMGCYAPVMLACEAYKVLMFVWILGGVGMVSEFWKLRCRAEDAENANSGANNRTGQWTMLDWMHLARYLLMGWAVLPVLGDIAQQFPLPAVFVEVLGGLLYTGGVFFLIYGMEFHMAIWHSFVLVASLSFYTVNLAVLVGR